jgi:hypothetical protein
VTPALNFRSALILTAGLAATTALGAATIDKLDVTRSKGVYSLVADAHLEATPESIYAVLVDYDDNRFSRISSVYKESRYLEPAADGTPVIYTRMEGCVLWYCMTLRRTERLETERPRYIKSSAIPEQSDFKSSVSEWVLEPDGVGGTYMTYKIQMEPAFRVPPIVGPWYLKHTLSTGGVRAVSRIERLARQLDGLPVGPEIPSGGRK